MAIAGFVGHKGGTYEVELSPSPGNTTKWSYNASRPFELITQLFITPLDPKTRYTAWLRNTDKNATLQFRSGRYKFTNQDAADKFEALSAHLPQGDKKKNVGAIVGGTVGRQHKTRLTADRRSRRRGAHRARGLLRHSPPQSRGAYLGGVSFSLRELS